MGKKKSKKLKSTDVSEPLIPFPSKDFSESLKEIRIENSLFSLPGDGYFVVYCDSLFDDEQLTPDDIRYLDIDVPSIHYESFHSVLDELKQLKSRYLKERFIVYFYTLKEMRII